jgi:hypothetical protein
VNSYENAISRSGIIWRVVGYDETHEDKLENTCTLLDANSCPQMRFLLLRLGLRLAKLVYRCTIDLIRRTPTDIDTRTRDRETGGLPATAVRKLACATKENGY